MYGRRVRIEAEQDTPGQAARLQDPHLKLRTDLRPSKAMERTLLALDRGGFDTVMWFNGGVEDPTPESKEGMHVRDVVEAMRELDRPSVPLLGLKAVVRYRRNARVMATAKVGRFSPAKVKITVRGAVYRSDWYAVNTIVKGRVEGGDKT
jgi:hypothetical protein